MDLAAFSVSSALREFSLHQTGIAHVSHLAFPYLRYLLPPFRHMKTSPIETTAQRAVKKSAHPQDGCPSAFFWFPAAHYVGLWDKLLITLRREWSMKDIGFEGRKGLKHWTILDQLVASARFCFAQCLNL